VSLPAPGASCPIANTLYSGDCRVILPTCASESVDLIVTSPPYADQRKNTYGGVPPDEYVAWFLPIADELYRVLKPRGSFVLNIKERVVNGERHTYVIELILDAQARLVVDGGILLAQKELLSGQVAQPFPLSAATKRTAPSFLWRRRPGSSSCSPRRAMWCSTRSWGRAARR